MSHPADDSAAERPWLDRARPLEERVAQLLAVMTLSEKVLQLHQPADIDAEADRALLLAGGPGTSLYSTGAPAGEDRHGAVARTGRREVQRLAVQESRLGIPVLFARDVLHGHRTVFPIPLGLAASWDEDLVRRCAAVAAEEAVADGVGWTFAPMVDLVEDPRWGRVAESFGESPVLSGRLASASVAGFQGGGAVGGASVAACAKHFVGYGLVQGGRDYNTVQVGENTLRNLHLRPFRAAVGAGCRSVMAAFTDVDGVPMHAHEHLLRDVLKGEWGFDGVVVADWNGVGQLVAQGVATDARDAARQAILAGVDVDMASGAYLDHLPGLVAAGEVPLAVVDDAVRRVLRLKLRSDLFENPYARQPSQQGEGAGSTDAPVNRALAHEAAVSSMVLVKNAGLLPLSPDLNVVHLCGPFVHEGAALLGTWALDGRGDDVVTPAAALQERLGAQRVVVSDGRFSDLALASTRSTDLTVLLLGEHPQRSGENSSISTLELPPGQLDLLRHLARSGRPIVVVIFTGRPLELGPVLDLADAVLLGWHPGVEAGSALVDLLVGDVDPSGRLPMTFPRTVGHVPTSTHQRPTGRPVSPEQEAPAGRYGDAPAPAELPFGYGLTYGSCSYALPELSSTELSIHGELQLSCAVTNTAARACREVVQLYLHDLVADVTRPILELADWRTVLLAPQETVRVVFTVTAAMFGYYDRRMRWRVDPGAVEVVVGPDAARGHRLRLSLTL